MRRFALLLDGGFVVKRLEQRLSRAATAADVDLECARIAQHPALTGHELLRRYFYDAPPASGTLVNPMDGSRVNLGRSAVFTARSLLLDEVELLPNMALRQGELVRRGWRIRPGALRELAARPRMLEARDITPHLEQKGVDLRIGLDIARLSLRRLVDTIVVVSGDSDMLPAFRFARREGIRVCLDHLGAPVMRSMRAHVDVVL